MKEMFTPEAMKQAQSQAWFSVCQTLDIVFPGWMSLKQTTSESAIEAIKRLGSGAIKIPCVTVGEDERVRLQKRVSELQGEIELMRAGGAE